MEDNTNT